MMRKRLIGVVALAAIIAGGFLFLDTSIAPKEEIGETEDKNKTSEDDTAIDISGWKKFFGSVDKPEKFLYYRYIKKKYYANAKEFYTLSFLENFGVCRYHRCFPQGPIN